MPLKPEIFGRASIGVAFAVSLWTAVWCATSGAQASRDGNQTAERVNTVIGVCASAVTLVLALELMHG
jgi:hypothetical protein